MLFHYAHLLLVVCFFGVWTLIFQFAYVRIPRARESERPEI